MPPLAFSLKEMSVFENIAERLVDPAGLWLGRAMLHSDCAYSRRAKEERQDALTLLIDSNCWNYILIKRKWRTSSAKAATRYRT